MKVKDVAKELELSVRQVYDMAAPNGPIPCHRFGRTVRFEEADIAEYKKSCRYTPMKQPVAGVSHLTASSPEGDESELRNFFRKAGLRSKPKPTTKRKLHDSTRLQLVHQIGKPR